MWRKRLHQSFPSTEIVLLILFVMTEPLFALPASPPLKETSFDGQPFNDVLFTEDVLVEVSARSRIECSKKCVETEGCVMCTFLSSPQGPPGQCRLHNQLQKLSDAWQNTVGAKTVARRMSCGEGYIIHCNRCLRAVSQAQTYADAETSCQQLSQGQLVMPQTAADVLCLQLFLQNISQTYSWVGADDKDQATVFRWNDGSLLPTSSTLWRKLSSEPENENPGNDCARAWQVKPNLYDGVCTAKYSFVCQTLI